MNYTKFNIAGWPENVKALFRNILFTFTPESCDLILKCKGTERRVKARVFAANSLYVAAHIPSFCFSQISQLTIDFCEPFELEWIVHLAFGYEVWIEPESVARMIDLCNQFGISFITQKLGNE